MTIKSFENFIWETFRKVVFGCQAQTKFHIKMQIVQRGGKGKKISNYGKVEIKLQEDEI